MKIPLINTFIELKSYNLPDFGKDKVILNKINNLNSLYTPTRIFNNVHDVTQYGLIIILIFVLIFLCIYIYVRYNVCNKLGKVKIIKEKANQEEFELRERTPTPIPSPVQKRPVVKEPRLELFPEEVLVEDQPL